MKRPFARLHDSPRVLIYHDDIQRCRYFYVDNTFVATLLDDDAFVKSRRDEVDIKIHKALQFDQPAKRLT